MKLPVEGALEVRPVRGRGELNRFLRLPWRIYADDPAWVPPLLSDLRRLLDPQRHPFHRHAEAEYFIAWREGRAVGRIAAVVNHRHNEFHDDRTGFFGFFESVDDPAVAKALLEAAEGWLRERGMERARGPASFSTNDESGLGLLIEGHERAPVILMAHTPRHYPRLLEASGYTKARDLLAYLVDDPSPPTRLVAGVERLRRRGGVRLRALDAKRLEDELEVVQSIYNSAWERNWGFVPLTEEEFADLARQLRPILDPELCVIAEVEGEPAGFALALPDYNQVLRHLNGRLLPFGFVKALWHRRRIDALRVITLGLRPGYRRLGLDAMMYLRIFEKGVAAGYRRAECSWILEDNWEMRRGLERLGARPYKTYRLYEKTL